MKIITVIGARPQFVKASVVSRALAAHRESGHTELLVHTGQHYDEAMSQVFFEELEIPSPDYNLGVGGGSHAQNTGRMMQALEPLLLHEKPDWVLVYGDTDSTLAAALTAAKLHIPVAHVEAGLRSFNRRMPEEINRIATDHVSSLLFTPTSSATDRLRVEGIEDSRISFSGDVMFDAAIRFRNRAVNESRVLADNRLEEKQYVATTIHRAENVDNVERLQSILNGLGAARLPVVLPLHPRTALRIANSGLTVPQNVRAIDPLGYLDMTALLSKAKVIATDSGGVQKEAFFHRVPCVTMRDETEWTELIDCGANVLSGADAERIAAAVSSSADFPANVPSPYGSGNAGELIANRLLGRTPQLF